MWRERGGFSSDLAEQVARSHPVWRGCGDLACPAGCGTRQGKGLSTPAGIGLKPDGDKLGRMESDLLSRGDRFRRNVYERVEDIQDATEKTAGTLQGLLDAHRPTGHDVTYTAQPDRRFAVGHAKGDIVEFVAWARSSSASAADQIDPILAERMIRGGLRGRGHARCFRSDGAGDAGDAAGCAGRREAAGWGRARFAAFRQPEAGRPVD
jgi:hypothetical protein